MFWLKLSQKGSKSNQINTKLELQLQSYLQLGHVWENFLKPGKHKARRLIQMVPQRQQSMAQTHPLLDMLELTFVKTSLWQFPQNVLVEFWPRGTFVEGSGAAPEYAGGGPRNPGDEGGPGYPGFAGDNDSLYPGYTGAGMSITVLDWESDDDIIALKTYLNWGRINVNLRIYLILL